jgi:hypothetical protein
MHVTHMEVVELCAAELKLSQSGFTPMLRPETISVQTVLALVVKVK